jgi:type II secretion system (T2SS) protein G
MSHKKAQKSQKDFLRWGALFVLVCGVIGIVSIEARAALSKKQARKVIQTVAGWSLPSDAVRIDSIRSSSAASADVSAELELVFRLRLYEGRWELREIRVGQDVWEQLAMIARAANAELPASECDAPSEFASSKSDTELTNKRARCLIASVFGITLPSDDVRIKAISPFGLSLGSETPALVTALVRADFRLARDAKDWHVTEFKSGNRDWVNITGLTASLDQIKRTAASEDLSVIVKALSDFRRERGYFVVSDKESVLIDHLSPHYLARVIRVDPWHRPYRYEGQQDHYSLRSLGPDGKPNTPDDIVVSGPSFNPP